MPQFISNVSDARYNLILSIGVALFSTLTLMLERGNSYVGALLLLAALVVLFINRSHAYRGVISEGLFFWGPVLFVLSGFISLVTSPQFSTLGFSGLKNHLVFVYALLIFIAIRQVGCSRKILFFGFFIGAISAGILGAYQVYYLGHGVAHGNHWKIIFGDTSLMLGLLSLAYIVPSSRDKQTRWMIALALIAFLFGLLGSLTSGTRGGWIALPLLLWLVFTRSIHKQWLRYACYGVFLLSVVVIYNTNDLARSKVDRAVNEIENYIATENPKGTGSLASRFEMWQGAWIMFKENPLQGVGFGEFGGELNKLRKSGEVNTVSTNHPHAHSDVFNVAAEKGIVGLVGLFALYIGCLCYFQRRFSVDAQLSTAGTLLCLGFMDFGLSDTILNINIGAKFFAVMLAVLAGYLAYLRRQASLEKAR